MDKDTTETTFNKVFETFPFEKLKQIVISAGCDRYIKKSKTLKLLYLMIITQLCGFESLHDIALKVICDKQLQKVLNLTSISASTLSRRLRQIDNRVWEQTFSAVKSDLWQRTQKGATDSVRLNVIDASTITLCLTRYIWADYRKSKSGIKLHQRIMVHNGNTYPSGAILTPARQADKTVMDELVILADDVLNVFDRGYVDYEKWDDYCERGIRFVSRLKSNAIIHVLEEKSMQTGHDLSEKIVLLGNPYTNQMTHPVRLIETLDKDGNKFLIVTNDLELPITEISDIYRLRWQVELFFKWIKQHLIVKKFFGTSPNAVYGQIWIALIVYCLLQNVRQSLPNQCTMLEILWAIRPLLYHAFSELLAALGREPTKKSGKRCSFKDDYDELLEVIHSVSTKALDATNEDMYL